MPYARRTMRRYRKSNTQRKGRRFFRNYGKAYNSYNNRSGYNNKYRRTKVRLPTRIMPDYTLVKMKDTRLLILDQGDLPSDGTYSSTNEYISGSDIYNCWRDAVGDAPGQPTGFDQWAAFYKNFIVHKSSIRVTPLYWILNSSGTQRQQPFQITVTPVDVSATGLSFDVSFDEQPYSKFRMYNAPMSFATDTNITATQTGTQTIGSVYNSMMTKKILGYKDLSDVSDVYGVMDPGATVVAGNSPAEQFYWNIEVKSLILSPGGDPVPEAFRLPSMVLKVDMYYKVQLLNRRTIIDSGNDQEDDPP